MVYTYLYKDWFINKCKHANSKWYSASIWPLNHTCSSGDVFLKKWHIIPINKNKNTSNHKTSHHTHLVGNAARSRPNTEQNDETTLSVWIFAWKYITHKNTTGKQKSTRPAYLMQATVQTAIQTLKFKTNIQTHLEVLYSKRRNYNKPFLLGSQFSANYTPRQKDINNMHTWFPIV